MRFPGVRPGGDIKDRALPRTHDSSKAGDSRPNSQCQESRKMIAVSERCPQVTVRLHPPELPETVELAVPEQVVK